jgi:glutamate N-acetyltransferase/amino-acid N-acetyltransferase
MSAPLALPSGFRTSAVACGLKSDPTTLDLSLFVSDVPASAAGVFTTNRVVGAPVLVSRERVPAAVVRAVVINSGNSNACTGEQGVRDARGMAADLAGRLGCDEQAVLVCSTGVIGRPLPTDRIAAGMLRAFEQLESSVTALEASARGLMTTDTFPKLATRSVTIAGRTATLTGVCKGAAMIAPHMATMLAVVMTDARIPPELAQSWLRQAVDDSFNCISVDGHMSTSDSVLLLANGQSGISAEEAAAGGALNSALKELCRELSQLIIRDAEGAGHFVIVDVRGLPTRDAARQIARAVCESALVKTAIAGNDPNWGRIVSAAGYAGVDFHPRDCSLSINGTRLFATGQPVPFDAAAVSQGMKSGQVHIELQFTRGDAFIRMWTSDLTAEYVRLNADYTT